MINNDTDYNYSLNNNPLITNIQRFSLHDGPGIRITVFLKGCSLRCPWCSNPENLNLFPEKYNKNGTEGIYGVYMSCDDIYNELMKDKAFYGEFSRGNLNNISLLVEELDNLPGGITFSGGEPLLHINKLEPILKKLYDSNTHITVETCLFVKKEKLKLAIQYIDLFYVDIKMLDKDNCKTILYGNLNQYLQNLKILFESNKPVVFRIPVIGGYTDGEENRRKVIELLEVYHPIKVELIKEHNLGESKYVSLGERVPNYNGVSDELIEKYKTEIENIGIPVQVCYL